MAHDDIARTILQTTPYAVVATADPAGTPWATPVWFATDDLHQLFWVSNPDVRHSRNITDRPDVALVVFDSTVPPGTGQGVYMAARAEQLTDPADIAHGIDVFSRSLVAHGAEVFRVDQVTGAAPLRLYRARVHEHSILDPDSPHDVRTVVHPSSSTGSRRP